MIEKIIETNSDGWKSLLDEISVRYGEGSLIKHEWLKFEFGFREIDINDYDGVQDFLKAIDTQQFAYMSLVERLKHDLLTDYKICIKNIVGEGYAVVPSSEQTQYGFDLCVSKISKAFHDAFLIIDNVKAVDLRQQAQDNDLRAKMGKMKMMMKGVK